VSKAKNISKCECVGFNVPLDI